ncbi:hypothetical protein ACPOL_1996 [Acidisarcina polymorpha]|uniref:Uncharacterized protein n=1 Tax=Acidisarcina polymorpha TaxID=2211140 RepID=A0A2Z5FX33_9BACT|nr:hypothetical protein ACPOL_1996 [Acidisarcina polymorpha]
MHRIGGCKSHNQIADARNGHGCFPLIVMKSNGSLLASLSYIYNHVQ